MNIKQIFAVVTTTLGLAAASLALSAADAPIDVTPQAQVDPEEVLHKIELNVAIKQYEKLLTAKYEAELELSLGPADNDLNAEQREEWLKRSQRKYEVLDQMAGRVVKQIYDHVLSANTKARQAAAAKETPKVDPRLPSAESKTKGRDGGA
jgi:hypothetical protein